MNDKNLKFFHPLIAGGHIPNDWFNKTIPLNISVGENNFVDSSFCFRYFFSKLSIALKIGNNNLIWGASIASEENGFIQIGNDCNIDSASVVCVKQISIGNNVLISRGVTIVDSDFHPLEPFKRIVDSIVLSPIGDKSQRESINASPVIIKDNVIIGFNATILKGVVIEEGVVIAAGSVVSKSVPANTYVEGNPAKPVSK